MGSKGTRFSLQNIARLCYHLLSWMVTVLSFCMCEPSIEMFQSVLFTFHCLLIFPTMPVCTYLATKKNAQKIVTKKNVTINVQLDPICIIRFRKVVIWLLTTSMAWPSIHLDTEHRCIQNCVRNIIYANSKLTVFHLYRTTTGEGL